MVSQSTPYISFANIIASYQEQYSNAGQSSQLDSSLNYEVVLDEEGGLISALMACLEETIRSKAPTNAISVEMDSEDHISEEEYKALLSEHRAWQLIRAVFSNRIPRSDPNFVPPSSERHLLENPYTSPEDLVQIMVIEDSELSLWATLLDHLQTRPLLTSPPPLEARHGYLPSTIRRARTKLPSSASSFISFDPDFTLRNPQLSLAGEDATYQHPFFETLFNLVRYGELESAIKVCEQGGEPWRGASLMGVRRWNMGGMVEGCEDGPMVGNQYKHLWKSSCLAIANNRNLLSSERQLYAALVSDLPNLLPACDTWEDQLWAHIQYRIEARLEQRRRHLGGFWQEELVGDREREEMVEENQGGLDEVFEKMNELGKPSIVQAMRDPYNISQQMILLERTSDLFYDFSNQILSLEQIIPPSVIAPLLRFFTHLTLILRSLNVSVPDDASNKIIEAYLRILEMEGQDRLVAMYAACLREGSGEESYARFLWSMDPSASKEARSEALLRAKKHNLDTSLIARETVRLSLEEVLAGTPKQLSAEPDIIPTTIGLTDRDVQLIRSVEWLTFLPETIEDALIRTNQLIRHFLCKGQCNAAQSLLLSLPSLVESVSSISSSTSHLLELDSYHRLFNIFNLHDQLADIVSQRPLPTASKLTFHAWQKDVQNGVDTLWTTTLGLVEQHWLELDASKPSKPELGEDENDRQVHLKIIRHIFIPDLVFRLHAALVHHAEMFPDMLQKALELASVVADENYRVFEGFLPVSMLSGDLDRSPSTQSINRLEAYLDKVREVALEALKISGSAFRVKTEV
ncbi:uncharacterized protein L203_100071 [Cryptococcus depauperatus CBS 7841]|uniref:Nuclear pore complex protein n=1 Tax=Cryptococcus depauperatus CBS 7841 TaxID=1295531 RepID=A0A1E3J0B0_9TREE|nr:nuclear pore complex protein Nup107 [Cryptococcus depauperatus CBS 7841]